MPQVQFAEGGGDEPSTTTKIFKPSPVNAQSILGIQRSTFGCPGFTGREAKQLIRPRTFRQLLLEDSEHAVSIPLFQRKYCWTATQARQWIKDVRNPKKTNGWNGCHGTGKAVFRKDGVPTHFICVDGQQRITTTMLLLIAIRDASMDRRADDAALTDMIDSVINVTVECKRRGRLIPSLADRPLYQTLLDGGATLEHDPMNFMKEVYSEFRLCLEPLNNDELREAADQALDEMYVTSVEILNDTIDLSAVFLWLQEASLLGFGAILQNLTPGVVFHACDMVRNLLLAPFMRRWGLQGCELESIYCREWFDTFETKLPDRDAVDTCIRRVISNCDLPIPAGQYEQLTLSTLERFRACRVAQHDSRGIELYARFVSFVEVIERHRADLDHEACALFILNLLRESL